MSMDAGTQIGPYKVEGEVGRGGMGVVYRAIDTRLDREVAIKALPEELAGDAGRLERFEREAKTLASLNHPNVAGILGIEEQAGAQYLVLEFVDGETLADRLDHGQLDVDDAIGLAVQISAGVEAAHDAGVIHRDLKPANIKITSDGIAKVLDFGLAKADEGHTSGSGMSQLPTQSTLPVRPAQPATVEGAILGTAAYMSPEQARGRKVDKRTDIWSFGVLLYEMLSGASPFIGETATDSIGAVLHKDLDFGLLPKGTPAGVKRVLARCVERDKGLRYRDIGDVRVEMLRAKNEPEDEAAAMGGALGAMGVVLVAMLLVLVGGGAWFGAVLTRPKVERVVSKFDIVVGSETEPLQNVEPRISPDGRRVAYIAESMIQLRDLDSFSSRALSGTEGALSLFWSPDGEWIGYTKDRSVYKVRVSGGGAIKVCDGVDESSKMATGGWTADARIVYRGEEDLFEVPARGGEPTVWLASGEEATDFHGVRAVPGSNAMVFLTHLSTMIGHRVEAFDGEQRVVIAETNEDPFTSVTYSPTGHVLYSRGFLRPSVWAVGFDASTMTVTSEPFQVMDGAAHASVSDDGTLLVKRGSVLATGGSLMWLNASDATMEPLGMGEDLEIRQIGSVSPDGRMVAVTAGVPSRSDLWVLDLERRSKSRLTFEESFVGLMEWSPDSKEIAVMVFDPAAKVGEMETTFLAVDGSGASRDPIPGIVIGFDRDWSRALMMNDFREPNRVVSRVRLDGSGETEEVYRVDDSSMAGVGLSGGALSPEGDLMLFSDSSSGKSEVFCIRLDGRSSRYQVSTDGGSSQRWSPDGAWVYFEHQTSNRLMRVPVEREVTEGGGLATVRFGMPEDVYDAQELGLNRGAGWAFGSGLSESESVGSKYLVLKQTDEQNEDRARLSIITNWYEEFREE